MEQDSALSSRSEGCSGPGRHRVVTGIDLDNRLVKAKRFFDDSVDIPYDSLIVATGAGQSYLSTESDAFARIRGNGNGNAPKKRIVRSYGLRVRRRGEGFERHQ